MDDDGVASLSGPGKRHLASRRGNGQLAGFLKVVLNAVDAVEVFEVVPGLHGAVSEPDAAVAEDTEVVRHGLVAVRREQDEAVDCTVEESAVGRVPGFAGFEIGAKVARALLLRGV